MQHCVCNNMGMLHKVWLKQLSCLKSVLFSPIHSPVRTVCLQSSNHYVIAVDKQSAASPQRSEPCAATNSPTAATNNPPPHTHTLCNSLADKPNHNMITIEANPPILQIWLSCGILPSPSTSHGVIAGNDASIVSLGAMTPATQAYIDTVNHA